MSTHINEYKFPLIDVVLYTKNHYKRSDSIWYDMAQCLWKDGQGFGPFHSYTENEKRTPQEECFYNRIGICNIICTRVRKLLKNKQWRIDQLFETISPQECWKVGYYTKDNSSVCWPAEKLPEYEYWEAVLRAHLSILSQMTAEELGYYDWSQFVPTIKELEKEKEETV